MRPKKYFVYILECTNGADYTGYTTDIERRYKEHCDGSIKCKYTRAFPPIRLAACWEVSGINPSAPMKIEAKLKKLRKKEKAHLIDNPCTISDIIDPMSLNSVSVYR